VFYFSNLENLTSCAIEDEYHSDSDVEYDEETVKDCSSGEEEDDFEESDDDDDVEIDLLNDNEDLFLKRKPSVIMKFYDDPHKERLEILETVFKHSSSTSKTKADCTCLSNYCEAVPGRGFIAEKTVDDIINIIQYTRNYLRDKSENPGQTIYNTLKGKCIVLVLLVLIFF
jgi:hypothetical protein